MIQRGPELAIPDVSLPAFVLRRTAERGGAPAFIDGASGRELSHSGLADAVGRVASALHRRGLRKGDVMAIFSPNLPEYPIAFHAVASLGGIKTTVNALYTADELAFQLRDSSARYLLTVPSFMERASRAVRDSHVEEIFVFGEADGATPFGELLSAENDIPAVDIDPDRDVVALPYSSGTTGLPKGVMLTHRNMVANICQTKHALRVGEDDRVLGVLPFFHIYGMTVIMNMGIEAGATVVTMPRFDLEEFLRVLQDHRVTRAYVAPPIMVALAKHALVERFDLSGLKLLLSGAAPLDARIADACAERLGCRVIQGYGLTEASPVTHCPSDHGDWRKPGSIGPCLPGTECRVVDVETGAELDAEADGELHIRGPQVMRGYLNNADATAATVDVEGWLHTGDIGHADADGDFFIVDRLKELIKYKGYQVAPAELEAVLLSHPAVADAAVVGSPDVQAGEVPKAFVVLRHDVTADALMEFVSERVAPHKRVRLVETIDEIPKSSSGKILRRVLVDRERARVPPS